jgi:hypothetical protein
LIDSFPELKGYSSFVCDIMQDSELELEWALYDDAWFLDVLVDGQATQTPLISYRFDASNDFALRCDYKLAKEIRGLWCLGHRLVLRMRNDACNARVLVAEVGKVQVTDRLRMHGLVEKLYEEPQPRVKDLPEGVRSALETTWGQPWELVDVQLLGGPLRVHDDEADASAGSEELLSAIR